MTEHDDMDERRQFPGFTQSEKERFLKHLYLEEQREKEENAKFKEGAERMARIEEELKPLKSMYYAVIGSGAVATLLLGTLLFIYSNDRTNAGVMQEAIYKQGVAIEKLIQSHQELERDYRRDMSRVERDIERLHPSHPIKVPQP